MLTPLNKETLTANILAQCGNVGGGGEACQLCHVAANRLAELLDVLAMYGLAVVPVEDMIAAIPLDVLISARHRARDNDTREADAYMRGE